MGSHGPHVPVSLCSGRWAPHGHGATDTQGMETGARALPLLPASWGLARHSRQHLLPDAQESL